MTTLAENYDALLLDLDGTVYLGGQPIDHVAPALARAKQQGARSVFVRTTPPGRRPEVAASLAGMGVPAEPDDVLTSPQAAAVMLTDRHPAGTKVLVDRRALAGRVGHRGGPGAGAAGHRRTRPPSSRDIRRTPAGASSRRRASRCAPVRTGWPATSTARCRPIAGCCRATGRWWPRWSRQPDCSHGWRASRRDRCSMPRSGWSDSQRPLVVGDRLDTDIACAVAAGSPSLLVFTGVSTAADLLAAVPEQRPTYLSFDLRGLVEEDHAVRIPAASSSGSSLEWSVTVDADSLVLAANRSGGERRCCFRRAVRCARWPC